MFIFLRLQDHMVHGYFSRFRDESQIHPLRTYVIQVGSIKRTEEPRSFSISVIHIYKAKGERGFRTSDCPCIRINSNHYTVLRKAVNNDICMLHIVNRICADLLIYTLIVYEMCPKPILYRKII